MAVVLVLLLFMVLIINLFHFLSMDMKADALLDNIISYYGIGEDDTITSKDPDSEIQETDSGESMGDSEGILAADQEEAIDDTYGFDINGNHSDLFSFLFPDIKQVDVLDAMFFTVSINPQGQVTEVDVSRIMETASYASNMALSLYQEGKKTGWLEKCRYMTAEDQSGNVTYVFLHRDRDYANRMRVLVVSLIFSAIFIAANYILIFFMSGKMLQPVSENIEKQKNFITNASHELKTPLAIIQVNAEALELYNGENKWTANIREQISRLSVMLNHMLTLSRADEGIIRQGLEQVDLTEITKELLPMFSEQAEQNNLPIFQHIELSEPLMADRAHIEQLLTVLIDNAVKYALTGTTIEIHIYTRDRNTTFETVNRCEMLPECEPDRLFERFFRPDSTRYSSTPGNGIGLSAAKAIAVTYGGVLTCRYEGKDFIRFTLVFRTH